MAVYAKTVFHLKESSPIDTDSHYGFSKYLAEISLNSLCKTIETKFLSVRVPVLLVPGAKNNFLSAWKAQAMAGQSVAYSNSRAEFNSIGDGRVIFEACQLALSGKFQQDFTMNIAASNIILVEELVSLFLHFCGGKISAVEASPNKPAQTLDVTLAKNAGLSLFSISESLEWYLNEQSSD